MATPDRAGTGGRERGVVSKSMQAYGFIECVSLPARALQGRRAGGLGSGAAQRLTAVLLCSCSPLSCVDRPGQLFFHASEVTLLDGTRHVQALAAPDLPGPQK